MPYRRPTTLAIDPGTREMGYACFDERDLVDYGVKTVRQQRTTKELFANIDSIFTRLVREKQPTVLVLEKNNFSQITQNARLTIAMARMRTTARRFSVKTIEYNPRTVRKVVCNNGNATKVELARTLAAIYPELRAYLESNRKWRERYYQNAFDAIACGLTFLRRTNLYE